jgi:hypothetical protein
MAVGLLFLVAIILGALGLVGIVVVLLLTVGKKNRPPEED